MRSNFLTEKKSFDTNISNVYAAGGKMLFICSIKFIEQTFLFH